MGKKNLMILRNHGTLTVGHTCADAFMRIYYLERACTIQVRALAGGAKLNPTMEGVAEKTAGQGRGGFGGPMGGLAWPGLLRLLDRKDTSYRN
jgi:ribulose-5-phosphate 4-epimerase/fuculose-1-phosphate aldolase